MVSIFTDQEPDADDASDGVALSLGTKFFSSAAGTVTHGRWRFPLTAPSGPVDWVLYTLAGDELARATFAGSTPGWQTVALATPVAYDTPSVELVAVVETPDRYVATVGFFGGGAVVSGPLTAPADGNNGRVSAGATYPTGSFSNSCYFVDVVFLAGQAVAVGQATETSTATAVTPAHTAATGGATETDTSQPVTVSGTANPTATGPRLITGSPPGRVTTSTPTGRQQ